MTIRTLVLCDDQWHPAADVQRGFAALGASQFDFEFETDGAKWLPEKLTQFPLVIVAKANHIHSSNPAPWLVAGKDGAFRDFVQRGGGLFLIHGGTCYKDRPEMRRVTGGAFLSHPEQCDVTIEPRAGHPVTAGVNTFVVRDEHYLMALDDGGADVFLTTRSQHGVQPAGWTRREGNGRVCALTPGHNPAVWVHPEFQKLLLNAIRWTAKLDRT